VMPEKIRLNREYANRRSVFNDIRLIMRTVGNLGR
jgi:lipopolysaccharide/colanic/teichoic acid biosynthesis glycosyltransferase